MRCNYCGWNNPEGIHRCEKCGARIQESLQNYKRCPNGHYYQGDHCPYCKPQRTIIDYGPYQAPYRCDTCGAYSNEYNNGDCPYCGAQLQGQPEDTYPWWRFSGHETTIIPTCKHCGHRVRRSIPSSNGCVSYLQDDSKKITPWNYKWDGKCEYCGYDYTIGMEILLDDYGQKKKTTVSADSSMIPINRSFDEFTVLSGVIIRTFVDETKRGEIFLSANELKYLIDSLKDSPLLEQCDYKYDGT